MKILFITSCLEPGRDGVGDYTSQLSEECIRRGHNARLLALNDPHVSAASRSADTMRLSARDSWADRVKTARDFVAAFSPDFVSVQFVCYGFHPRGIDFSLAAKLSQIIGAHSVQIMFHELWIGAETGARLKDRLTGSLQRRTVFKVLRQLAPRVVHTSNPAYVALLRERGIVAERLPLFGAIPISGNTSTLSAHGEKWTLGMFGTLHPVWPPEPLFSLLKKTGRRITIAHAGRIGAGEHLWEKIARDYAGALEFIRIGEQPPEKIAEFFANINFGVATTPWEIIGKSAAVAAMLEHGLPVIVNRDDIHYAAWSEQGYSPQLIKMDESLPAKLTAARRQKPRSILPEVAAHFLADIKRPPENPRDE